MTHSCPVATEPCVVAIYQNGYTTVSAGSAVSSGFLISQQSLDEALVARGLTEENTVFIVVGDHGEGLSYPKHHGKGHGNYLYPSTTEVPWVVRQYARGFRVLFTHCLAARAQA